MGTENGREDLRAAIDARRRMLAGGPPKALEMMKRYLQLQNYRQRRAGEAADRADGDEPGDVATKSEPTPSD